MSDSNENPENKEIEGDKKNEEISENKENKVNKENNEDFKYEILPEDQTNFDLSFKIIVIDDIGAGKSCLTNYAVKNIFDDAYNATVGYEFLHLMSKMMINL